MTRSVSKVTINKFSSGLYSDFTELETPAGITVEEDNCDLTRQGTRRRRRGVINEDDAVYEGDIEQVDLQTYWLDSHLWTPVAEIGNLVYIVLQVGNILHFYDASGDPLSANKKGFTVDLDTFKVPTIITVASYDITTAVIKGALFVAGEFLEPFYIEYDVLIDNITTTQVNIQVRDFAEQNTTLPRDEEQTTAATDAQYRYDIYNQGWHNARQAENNAFVMDFPINVFLGGTTGHPAGMWPSKNAPWWLGKRIQPDHVFFDWEQWSGALYGDSLAPLGHFILDAFRKDRSTASGIAGLPIEIDPTRPKAVAAFSGRVFYLKDNSIYFSQLVQDDLNVAGKCFQEADPTAETVSDLVDTDGGVVTITEMGKGIRMFVMRTAILVYADNGIWVLQGAGGSGFSATSYQISRISSTGSQNLNSIIDTEGTPFWFGPNAISTIAPSKIDPSLFEVVNIIDKRLMKFYNAIPLLCRQNASGSYDLVTKTMTWTYRSDLDPDDPMINRFKYDRMLSYNTIYDAFYPYSFDTTDSGELKRPFIAAILNAGVIFRNTLQDNVVDSNGDQVIDSNLDNVVANRFSLLEKSDPQKLWVWYYYDHGSAPPPAINVAGAPDVNSWGWTFATLTNETFLDFPDYFVDGDEGGPASAPANYISYLNCFYQLPEDTMTYEQLPYVYVFTRNTDYTPPAVNPIPTPEDLTLLGTTFLGEWDEDIAYVLGDSVKYTPNSTFYVANTANTGENPSLVLGSWDELPQWLQFANYTTGGVVVWKNVLYISLSDTNTQNEPGVFADFWDIVGSI